MWQRESRWFFWLGKCSSSGPRSCTDPPLPRPPVSRISTKSGPWVPCKKWLDDLYSEARRRKRRIDSPSNCRSRSSRNQASRSAKSSSWRSVPTFRTRRWLRHTGTVQKNDTILQFIIESNEEVIDTLQEEKLDQVQDTQAFLDSPEWQMPHRLISLSRYWMSWSAYYRAFSTRQAVRNGRRFWTRPSQDSPSPFSILPSRPSSPRACLAVPSVSKRWGGRQGGQGSRGDHPTRKTKRPLVHMEPVRTGTAPVQSGGSQGGAGICKNWKPGSKRRRLGRIGKRAQEVA